ncbi:hypothetical protein [Photobacterium profundum]|nr:hypothetical protein [Photobacterium profundum]
MTPIEWRAASAGTTTRPLMVMLNDIGVSVNKAPNTVVRQY